jgi:hypothetical protein
VKVQRIELKRLVQPLIGVNLGQLARREVKITDLPDMFFASRGKDEPPEDESGLRNFFEILDS